MLHQHANIVLSREEARAGEHLIKHNACSIDVTGRDGLPVDLLGSHIIRGARERLPRDAHRLRLKVRYGLTRQNFYQTKIGEEQGPISFEKHVSRLDIAMNQAVIIGVLERIQHLADKLNGLRSRDLPLFAHTIS